MKSIWIKSIAVSFVLVICSGVTIIAVHSAGKSYGYNKGQEVRAVLSTKLDKSIFEGKIISAERDNLKARLKEMTSTAEDEFGRAETCEYSFDKLDGGFKKCTEVRDICMEKKIGALKTACIHGIETQLALRRVMNL